MYVIYCVDIAFLYDVSINVHPLLWVLWNSKRLQSWMSNPNEGNEFMYDVNSSVCTLLCGYCQATEDYIPKP
jgi:hypothetical protein